jgi:hypothetical protein
MNPSLTSPPPLQAPEETPHGAPTTPAPVPSTPATGSTCARCGGSMAATQEWCLHCGAGAPGALRRGTGLGSVAVVIAVSVVLVLGAAAAAYAALTEKVPKTPTTIASTPAVSTPAVQSTPTTSIQTIPTPTTSSTPSIPSTSSTPPKIPLSTPTPKSSGSTQAEANNPLFPAEKTKSNKTGATPATKTTGTNTTSKEAAEGEKSGAETKSGSGTEPPNKILLDTDAASTYNPNSYPETSFGDPSLVIDGDSTTSWTAEVQPSLAPQMAVGLLIDMKNAQRVAKLNLITSSLGLNFEVYGARATTQSASGATAPAAITDPAWVKLSGVRTAKKKSTKIKLREGSKSFRFVVLWIIKAPAPAIGTPTQPGAISVSEVSLFSPAA